MDVLKKYLLISITVLVISVCTAILLGRRKKQSDRILTPFNALTFGTLLACFLLFVPLYFAYFSEPGGNLLEILLMSVHNTIRLFVVDSDFDFIRDSVASNRTDPVTAKVFSTYATILFILAPLLTYGFILSLFKNASFALRMIFDQLNPVYVFSCLNKRSLTLARSKRKKEQRAVIIFTGVPEECDEDMTGLKEMADGIGAYCFSKDVAKISLWRLRRVGRVGFYIMDADDTDTIRKATDVTYKYGSWEKTSMLVFVDSDICSLALSNLISPIGDDGKPADDNIKMNISSVNSLWSFIYGQFDKSGLKLFENAKKLPGRKESLISAVIVGCGTYGSAMLRTLAWYCQMDRYILSVNVIDSHPNAERRFAAQCPELMDSKYNGTEDRGLPRYTIRFFPGVDLMSAELDDILKTLGSTTYAFVDAGSDQDNVELAQRIRKAFERMNIHPDIQAVVEDPLVNRSLDHIHNMRGQQFDIEMIGDTDSRYSTEATEDFELLKTALRAHCRWGEQKTFWAFNYNSRSSFAVSLYRKALNALDISGANLPMHKRSPEQIEALRRSEHIRWVAYMRSEGYVYAKKRNDLGKQHNLLVPYDELPDTTKDKYVLD